MCANLCGMQCTELPTLASSIWIVSALSAHKAPQTYDVFHPILSAVGTASCPSITWHPEIRYGPATPAFGVLDVHHPILFAVGAASCPSITWHPEIRYGPATPAFGALDVHHPILFAGGTASCPSVAWHPKMRSGPATPAFGVLDVHHPILFAVGTASRPSVAWHPENRLGSATHAFGALDVHHPILFAVGTASCPSITGHPERWYGPATSAFGVLDVHHPILFAVGAASCPSITRHPEILSGPATHAFGALDVHHPILFAVGTASCPSITRHPERWYGPATSAFGVLDVHHPILFAVGAASCPSITRHPERWYGPATPAFGVPEVDHTIPFADGTARWSCIMLKSKRRVEHTSTHTGAKPPCLCANVRLSIHQASIDKEAVGRAALAVVALSSQNMREQQPTCSPAIFNQHQKQQLIDPLGGSKNEASIPLWLPFEKQVVLGHLSHSPPHCFRTLPSTSPAKGRRPCTGHDSSAWQLRMACDWLALPWCMRSEALIQNMGSGWIRPIPKARNCLLESSRMDNPQTSLKNSGVRMEGHTLPPARLGQGHTAQAPQSHGTSRHSHAGPGEPQKEA